MTLKLAPNAMGFIDELSNISSFIISFIPIVNKENWIAFNGIYIDKIHDYATNSFGSTSVHVIS